MRKTKDRWFPGGTIMTRQEEREENRNGRKEFNRLFSLTQRYFWSDRALSLLKENDKESSTHLLVAEGLPAWAAARFIKQVSRALDKLDEEN